jgi:ABC-type uncharacterized transport system ATPase subunit
MDNFALELDHLVKDFEDKRAVDDVSLEMKRGEILAPTAQVKPPPCA